MRRFDAFLSYNREDRYLVKQIANELDNVGIKVWFDESSLKGGQKWPQALAQYITDSRFTIVFLGPSGIGNWQTKEINMALDMNVKHGSPDIIPVILPNVKEKDFELPPFLGDYNSIDLRCTQASRLNLTELIEAITQKKIRISRLEIGGEFYLKLKRPDGVNRDIKIYTLPNPDRTKLLNLSWETFGLGIENLGVQIKNYGYTLSVNACFGNNDAGLVMATFLNASEMSRVKIGYTKCERSIEGMIIKEDESFFPELQKKPTIMLMDFEVKSGGALNTIIQKLHEKYIEPNIYFSVFGALTDKDDLKIKSLDELVAYKNLKNLGIKDYFIACTIHHPGIEPPLGLK